MNNKKSLLQDSLQELENIKNESLELAKEQLINESADLLEKKSAALFEKLIAGEDTEEEEEEEEDTEKDESLNEILNELKNAEDEESDEDMDSDEMGSEDDMKSDEEEMGSEEETEMSLDALRKAAEEQGFKLVQADSDDEEMDSDEMSDDEEEMDSDDEEEMDSDDEEDIEFNDDDEFSDVNVDDKVLAEPSDEEGEEEEEEENTQKINENFKRKNTKMRNTKKQVLKDLRDVSFNKLVEAYYNMDEEDSFVVKENEYMDDYEDEMPDYSNIGQLEEMEDEMYDMEDEGYGMEDEDVMYELDMPEGGYDEPMSDESWNMDEMSDEELNEMLSEMDVEETMHDVEDESGMRDLERESVATRTRDKFMKNPGMSKGSIAQRSELEEMFEEMSLEELQEMEQMLREDGDMEDSSSYMDNDTSGPSMSGNVRFETSPKEDYMSEQDLTEAEIEEMLSSMKEEEMLQEDELEENSLANFRTKKNVRNTGADAVAQGRPDRRSKPTLAEEEMEDESDVQALQEQLKKLRQENKALNEGFTNKVKSLENKVYDVTISALKAGFVNKFLLEHPLRENEKLQIIHRFANAQTKEQIKETYISLTNEFAKGQTVKDGSMLNESVQNKVGKVHRTDNVVVTEKNLMNENDESNRFKQLLNYNFGKRK